MARTLHLVDFSSVGRWLCLKQQASAEELHLPPQAEFIQAVQYRFPYWQDYRYLAQIFSVQPSPPPVPALEVPEFVSLPEDLSGYFAADPQAAQKVTIAEISAKLDQIEAEMKRIGYWHPSPPPLLEQYDQGELHSYLDAPNFELWLQCVFLVRARDAVETGDFPNGSHVGTMALRQYDYHSYVPEALTLVELLNEFDDLIGRRVGQSSN